MGAVGDDSDRAQIFREACGDAGIGEAAVLDLVEQRLVADLQARGGLSLVPVGAREHRGDGFSLRAQRGLAGDLLQRDRLRAHGNDRRRGTGRRRGRWRRVALRGPGVTLVRRWQRAAGGTGGERDLLRGAAADRGSELVEDEPLVAKDDQAADEVLELAHVPGIVVILKTPPRYLLPYLRRKCSIRPGMSSLRSRKGGTTTLTTLRR